MKRLVAALAVVVGLAGCGVSGEEGTTAPATNSQPAQERQLESGMEARAARVVPLIRQYEASPSPALLQAIAQVEPILVEINPSTGAASGLNTLLAEEFLAEFGS